MVFYVSRGFDTVTAQDIADAASSGSFTGVLDFDGDVEMGQDASNTFTVFSTTEFRNDVQIGNTSGDTLLVFSTVDIRNSVQMGHASGVDTTVQIGNDSLDTLTVFSTTEIRNGVKLGNASGVDVTVEIGLNSLDTMLVFATADFRNDVTLGNTSADTLTINASTVHNADIAIIANNIVTGTVTGMQLATGSTQKIGFWGATPVVRPPQWTITNAIVDRSFDANTVTLAELADVVATIVDDLDVMGLFFL